MEKQYVKPVVTVVKITESDGIMAIPSKTCVRSFENDPDTYTEPISISWGGTQKNDTEEKENGSLWAD